MARTIDSIVENHRRARELRAAGKPIWSKTVDIRSILREHEGTDEPGDEALADAARRIAAAFRAGLDASLFDVTSDAYERDLDEAVEDLETWTAETLAAERASGDDVVDMFNGRLEEIYDWADANRVWLG